MSTSSTERALVVLLTATEARRRAMAATVADLAAAADGEVLLDLLERLRMVPLIGRRLIGIEVDLPHELEDALLAAITAAQRRGRLLEELTLGLMANLEHAGVRAIPLKGAVLADELFGDPGMRDACDIDLLVDVANLREAVEVVERAGWRRYDDPSYHGALPDLHELLVHDELPSVEIHWRVHWHETRFAPDALARARPRGPQATLRMQPADELASLMLFYARDGFCGLRAAADIAAAWDRQEAAGSLPVMAPVAAAYPELAPLLSCAATVAAEIVGVPLGATQRLGRRQRLAATMANPFLAGTTARLAADKGLVDVALAPRGQTWRAARRQLVRVPSAKHDVVRGSGRLRTASIVTSHAARVLRRWVPAVVAAAARARRPVA